MKRVLVVLGFTLALNGIGTYWLGDGSPLHQFAVIYHRFLGVLFVICLALDGTFKYTQDSARVRAAARELRTAVRSLVLMVLAALLISIVWFGMVLGPPVVVAVVSWGAFCVLVSATRYVLTRDPASLRPYLAGAYIVMLVLGIGLSFGWFSCYRSQFLPFREFHGVAGIVVVTSVGWSLFAAQSASATVGRCPRGLAAVLLGLSPVLALTALPMILNRLDAIPFQVYEARTITRTPELTGTNLQLAPGGAPVRVEYAELLNSCGGFNCHYTAQRNWEHSAHRRAGENPIFRVAIDLLEREKGKAATKSCQGCHSPADVLLDDGQDTRGGVDCLSCHLVSSFTPEGNASFASANFDLREEGYFGAPGSALREYLIASIPEPHRKMFNVKKIQSSEYCASCHRVTLPKELNGAADFVVSDDLAALRQSQFGREGYTCQECHMKKIRDEADYDSSDHLMLGAALSLARIEGDAAVLDLARRWLAGDVSAQLFGVFQPRSNKNARLTGIRSFFDFDIDGTLVGNRLVLHYALTNTFIAHAFPKILDLARVWMEVEVRDETGRVLAKVGGLDASGQVLDGVPTLGGTGRDAAGNPIRPPRVWEIASLDLGRMAYPGQPVTGSFEIALRQPVGGAFLDVEARWMYQRTRSDLFYQATDGTMGSSPTAVLVRRRSRVPLPQT